MTVIMEVQKDFLPVDLLAIITNYIRTLYVEQ